MWIWSKEFARVCRPISRLTGSEWADAFRVVPPGTSPEPGKWRTSRTPYLKEPMDVATDRETEKVVLMFSSQLGKSECLLGIMGYYADQEPSPQLMLQPTVEMAEAFSKERISPMFAYSPGLQGKLEEGKDEKGTSRKSSTTIRMKHYPGGYLALVGANSPAGLASRPIRVLLCDEVDRYGVTKEGDPIKLAVQRTANFEASRKIVLVSTPTTYEESKIYEAFLNSDQRYFYVKCPHCGAEHRLLWENVRWDKDADGNALPMTASMYCPECGAKTRGPYRPDLTMLSTGRWVAHNPGHPVKGYQCNALYSPWVTLHGLVEEFVSCTVDNDREKLREFINLKLGEPWRAINPDEGEFDALLQRRESYPKAYLPDGVLMLTAGVDVQRNRLECSVYGWGRGRECWGIFHKIIYGLPDNPQTWAQLDGVLATEFKHKSGSSMPISCTFIDSGDGLYTNNVYAYTRARERQRVFSIKGRGGAELPFVGKASRAGTEKAVLFPLGVDAGKRKVMDRLDVPEAGPNFVHFDANEGAGFTEDFFKQLTAEKQEVVRDKNGSRLVWVKLRQRNEALDCAVYATAAMEALNPNFEMLDSYYSGQYQREQQAQRPARPRGTVSRGVEL